MTVHQLDPNQYDYVPDTSVSVRDVFGIDSDLEVPAFRERDDHVPEIDAAY